ncbi:hypothetical protein L361_02349 [Enterobacter sp. MGH 15]|nr:hypothetical protein L361_02349 [Enterobacter sp. MGH 15]
MSHLTTCEASRNATSSPELASGLIHCGSPDGLTINQSGLAPARASLSARQAKEMGLLTSGTFGPTSSTSSASADLSMSLANRLQQVTQTYGSTLYKLTWKEWDTPSGLCRLRQRASVRRTSESGPTGWPTPVANTNPQPETKRGLQHVSGAARLTGWQTPVANDSTGSTHCYSGKNQDGSPKVCLKLPGTALLAGWVTPTTRDWKDTSGMTAQREGKDRLDQLPRQAYTCGPLRLTVFGEMRTGSYVEMANGVQLNPAHSRWLMGLPRAWDESSPGWQEWQAATASVDSKATVTP